MPFQEFTCSGCNLSTISSFDLTDKPHLDCSSGIGHWVEAVEQSVQPTDEACPPDRHVYYTAFLSYIFCPYCGERLHSG